MLLGSTGKMGCALRAAFGSGHRLLCKNSRDFNAADFAQVEALVRAARPAIVLNTVALLGIDHCEKNPEKAFRLNTLYPKLLAELSLAMGFVLVHFSTDAVFDGRQNKSYVESDAPRPLNIYGATKYGGDCLVAAIAERFFLVRVSVLFGETQGSNQFVEKMLLRARQGKVVLRVADDIVLSPTFSQDVGWEIRRLIEAAAPFGLYHLANEGQGSLYELLEAVSAGLGLEVALERASYRDFPGAGIKNTHTPLASEKIALLRPWREAVGDYCRILAPGGKHGG